MGGIGDGEMGRWKGEGEGETRRWGYRRNRRSLGEEGTMNGEGQERTPRKFVNDHEQLDVYRTAFDGAMRLFELSRGFPREERYSLTDQMRRSSRSICANLAEAWRKRRYPAAFIAKLSDCEAEAAETITWIHFAHACGYLDSPTAAELTTTYHHITGMLVNMIRRPGPWLLK
jgi:four helix bundle protein